MGFAEIAAIVGVLASLASTYGSVKAGQAQKKKAKAAMNASNMANMAGSGAPGTATADRFKDEGSEGGLKEADMKSFAGLLGGNAKPASESEQGFGLGLKKLDQPVPEAQSFQAAAVKPEALQPAPAQTPQPKPAQSSFAQNAGGYADTLASLYGAWQSMKKGPPEPQQMPQLGPMDLRPTALRYGKY